MQSHLFSRHRFVHFFLPFSLCLTVSPSFYIRRPAQRRTKNEFFFVQFLLLFSLCPSLPISLFVVRSFLLSFHFWAAAVAICSMHWTAHLVPISNDGDDDDDDDNDLAITSWTFRTVHSFLHALKCAHTHSCVSRSSWFLVQPLLQYAHIVLSLSFFQYKYIFLPLRHNCAAASCFIKINT